jgi:enoyl-CoA hydratase
MDIPSAIANEYARGIETIRSGETQEGARRFASGEGRHGSFAAFKG